ncbi:MAG: radical SAM protein [Ruminococcus flavefaciens]|nr:radical SAM protein [Ruminococcus flavefaciens]
MKIFHHQDILQKLLKGERCYPLYIRLKPTNRCNQNCYYCTYKNTYLNLSEYNMSDEIPYEIMRSLLEDMVIMGVKAVTLSGGGEPLLYPYIEETMEQLLRGGIDLSIITNGSLLCGRKAELLSQAKWVRISIDTINAAKYSKIRGVKKELFEQLCNNISEFSQIKGDNCELGVNMVVTKDNCMEVGEMAKQMKQLGVNHVKYAPLLSDDTANYHKSIKKSVSDALAQAKEQLDSAKFKVIDLYTHAIETENNVCRPYHNCPKKEFTCVIGADAKVYLCQHKAYMEDGVVCDLHQGSFKEFWYSKEVTEKFQKFDAMETCRQHCVHDGRNQLINAFLNMDLNHVNFI